MALSKMDVKALQEKWGKEKQLEEIERTKSYSQSSDQKNQQKKTKKKEPEAARQLPVCVSVDFVSVTHVLCTSVERLFPAEFGRFLSVRVTHCRISYSHTVAGSRMRKKLLLDVDCGVDDAQAIMMALAAPSVQILGITCVHGNTSVENVCKNVLRVLQVCSHLEIPVFKGAATPILGDSSISSGHFHGKDGLGDAPDSKAPGLELVQKENAAIAMIRIVNENPGEVSLVATAPLTNLALAVRMDPSLPSKLKGLYIMGGNTESRGNTTVCGEFNFAVDPEAAYIVLKEYSCPTYLAGWEFTCYNKLSWEFCDEWLAQSTSKARFMKKIFQHSYEASQTERFQKELVAGSGFISCDSYAVAAAIDDSFIVESDQYPVSVELTGTHTRGMMIVDTVGFLKDAREVCLMRKVDLEKFKQMMMAALQ